MSVWGHQPVEKQAYRGFGLFKPRMGTTDYLEDII